MVHNTFLMTAMSDRGPEEFLARGDLRGHLVESAVGAYLIARSECEGFEVMWWREGNKEVDFVIRSESALTAIEVKGGAESGQSGMASFLDEHPEAKRLVVGGVRPLARVQSKNFSPAMWGCSTRVVSFVWHPCVLLDRSTRMRIGVRVDLFLRRLRARQGILVQKLHGGRVRQWEQICR